MIIKQYKKGVKYQQQQKYCDESKCRKHKPMKPSQWTYKIAVIQNCVNSKLLLYFLGKGSLPETFGIKYCENTTFWKHKELGMDDFLKACHQSTAVQLPVPSDKRAINSQSGGWQGPDGIHNEKTTWTKRVESC